MAYVYRHIRLDKDEVFYVGIGTRDDNYRRAYDKSGRNNYWKKIVSKTEFEVEIIMDGLDDDEAAIKEIEFISIYGRKDLGCGTLCNMNDGGRTNKGWIPSKEWREAHRLTRTGLKFSEEWVKNISESHKGISRPHTEESKRKLRLAKLGKRPHDNCIKAAIKANTGRKPDEKSYIDFCKEVIDVESGEKYKSIKEASRCTGINYRTLLEYLNGTLINKTSLRKVSGDKSIFSKEKKVSIGRSRKVIDTSNGEIFNSVKEAAENCGYTYAQLHQWLRGKNKNKSALRYLQ